MAKYKNVTAKIQFAESREDFDNMCFKPSDGGKYPVKKAIDLAQSKCGGVVELYSARNLFLGNLSVSYDRESNKWITAYLNKKGIELK